MNIVSRLQPDEFCELDREAHLDEGRTEGGDQPVDEGPLLVGPKIIEPNDAVE